MWWLKSHEVGSLQCSICYCLSELTSGINTEAIMKIFINNGWNIDKEVTYAYCPKCNRKER